MDAAIPVPVWQQISIVIIFTALLIVVVRLFSKAIADINSYYAVMVEKVTTQFASALSESNKQWQLYFDAKGKTNELVENQIILQLKDLTEAISRMQKSHDTHDTMIRHELDNMSLARKRLAKSSKTR